MYIIVVDSFKIAPHGPCPRVFIPLGNFALSVDQT